MNLMIAIMKAPIAIEPEWHMNAAWKAYDTSASPSNPFPSGVGYELK